MSSKEITFKTPILVKCKGWRSNCREETWMPAQVTLQKVLTIEEDDNELYSAHTSEIESPDDWFTWSDGHMCRECYQSFISERDGETKRTRKARKKRSTTHK